MVEEVAKNLRRKVVVVKVIVELKKRRRRRERESWRLRAMVMGAVERRSGEESS
jgi:hypothetical protein